MSEWKPRVNAQPIGLQRERSWWHGASQTFVGVLVAVVVVLALVGALVAYNT